MRIGMLTKPLQSAEGVACRLSVVERRERYLEVLTIAHCQASARWPETR